MGILDRLRNWRYKERRTAEGWFPDDERALEMYTRNRQVSGG